MTLEYPHRQSHFRFVGEAPSLAAVCTAGSKPAHSHRCKSVLQLQAIRDTRQVVVRLKSAKMEAAIETMDVKEAARLGGCCVVQ